MSILPVEGARAKTRSKSLSACDSPRMERGTPPTRRPRKWACSKDPCRTGARKLKGQRQPTKAGGRISRLHAGTCLRGEVEQDLGAVLLVSVVSGNSAVPVSHPTHGGPHREWLPPQVHSAPAVAAIRVHSPDARLGAQEARADRRRCRPQEATAYHAPKHRPHDAQPHLLSQMLLGSPRGECPDAITGAAAAQTHQTSIPRCCASRASINATLVLPLPPSPCKTIILLLVLRRRSQPIRKRSRNAVLLGP